MFPEVIFILLIFSCNCESCVSSLDELRDALDKAGSGDTVVICDGDYEEWRIQMGSTGVSVRAETPGHVSLHHNSYVNIGKISTTVGLDYVTILNGIK